MGSASREALEAAKAALGGLVEPRTGSDLLQVAAQVAATPALLSALSDASADGAAKVALVERLFSGASTSARAVLGAAVGQSWSTPDELVAGIEELGLRADAISHPDLAGELLSAAAVVDGSHELELELGS